MKTQSTTPGHSAITLALAPVSGTIAAGKPVKLTAHVTDADSGKVLDAGMVSFYDTSTSTLLGTAEVSPVAPKGVASIRVVLGVGVHNLTATLQAMPSYHEATAYSAITSLPETETVTGNKSYVASSVMYAQDEGASYILISQLALYGQAPPSGVVTFHDTVMNKVVATSHLTSLSQDFAPTAFTSTGPGIASQASVIGDFNDDGKPDFATIHIDNNTLSVFDGNGDGTFLLTGTYATGAAPYAIASGDFNGDGSVDLAVANSSGTVSILLGRGDGTFGPGSPFPAGAQPSSVTVSDFNGDGIQDLAVTNFGADDNTPGTVNILTGNGDGTFATGAIITVGLYPCATVAASFFFDGVQDLGYSMATPELLD